MRTQSGDNTRGGHHSHTRSVDAEVVGGTETDRFVLLFVGFLIFFQQRNASTATRQLHLYGVKTTKAKLFAMRKF